jgi:hypothetical protein
VILGRNRNVKRPAVVVARILMLANPAPRLELRDRPALALQVLGQRHRRLRIVSTVVNVVIAHTMVGVIPRLPLDAMQRLRPAVC